ncbi:RNA polymerase sigma factor [Anatilimnocola floriformis]|uniref:RNA polymerase sigma factor n=1 Tax=Anatilimnocola floriformis TaxID=2948575 RepID=UPI0020C20752|nr:sigma-70 family RNA polymerase sigma factor [Anatilimnocola floriformis]
MGFADERQLAAALGRGESIAWQALYDAHAARVWDCVARRVGPCAAEVADIVQETMLAAARSAHTFDPERGSLWIWLSGIARRQAALFYRRKQTRPSPRPAVDDESVDWLEGDETDPADWLAAGETADLVRQALAELPADYEILLAGKYFADLSLAQLAAESNCTEAALNSRLARARRAFRAAFARLCPDSVSTDPLTKNV